MYKDILKKISGQATLLFISGTILGYLGSIGWTSATDDSALAQIITFLGFGLILCAFLATNKSIVRRFILDDEELKKLISELQTGSPRQRRAAAYKLGVSKNPTIVPALIHAYDDVDNSVRQNVIDGLREIASMEAIYFLNSKEISPAPKNTVKTSFTTIIIIIIIAVVLAIPWIYFVLDIGMR